MERIKDGCLRLIGRQKEKNPGESAKLKTLVQTYAPEAYLDNRLRMGAGFNRSKNTKNTQKRKNRSTGKKQSRKNRSGTFKGKLERSKSRFDTARKAWSSIAKQTELILIAP